MKNVANFLLIALLLVSGKKVQAAELKPEDSGLDNGKGGHWGAKNDKDWVDNRWNNVDVGPIVSCALGVPGGNINKGIAIRAGEKAAVCFDGARLGICAAWSGPFVHFSPNRFGLIDPPTAAGPMVFSLPKNDLWNGASGRYRGLFLHGLRVTLACTIDGAEVFESPGAEQDGAIQAVSRSLEVGACARPLAYTLAGGEGSAASLREMDGIAMGVLESGEKCSATAVLGSGATLACDAKGARVVLQIPPHTERINVKILQWAGKKEELASFAAFAKRSAPPENINLLRQPGPPRWGAPLATKGTVSGDAKPYVIDSISVPFGNPFKAMFFCSGIDFLENGDAVISTLHGDVWIVSGIDGGLEKITWKRFATGLFQPFGVKVIENRIYVLGRDQITILNDTNNDGEADYYENFCNAAHTSAGGHDYSAGLESDSAGNLYHVDPTGLHRVSKSGEHYETIASGWRNPIALAVGPDDSITVSPQEGEWTPASQISEVKANGWYGFGGPRVAPNRPLGYDVPLCYMPRLIDNSTGGLVWASGKNWGPLSGQLLDLSFGQCSMQLVLRERIDGEMQGGVVPLGLRFPSGVVRGRVNPKDGQLYIVGTQGWVTSAVRDGCLQRIRYTGAKLCIPIAVKTSAAGMQITFSGPLDAASAEDAENYDVEQWNYRYGSQYGSREFSVLHPEAAGHDAVALSAAKIDASRCSVFLSMPGIRPVNQMRIKYHVKDSEGLLVRGEIDYTIHSTGAKQAVLGPQ